MYDDEDLLMISGIQHYAFCRRRWALIFIEQLWSDNEYTIGGTIFHKRAHDTTLIEKRGKLLISRDMPVVSRTLGIAGHCDVVEFRQDNAAGVPIFGREGKWLPCPVEYKKGSSGKADHSNNLQLCAQAICLEEMLACPQIETAYIYYGETKRRKAVSLDETLRKSVHDMFNEMRGLLTRNFTPRVKPKRVCTSCSLKNVCLPKLPDYEKSVSRYIDKSIKE